MDEHELYTLREAARELHVPLYRLRYAMHSRKGVERRLVGRVMLVTLANAREALGQVRPLTRRA